MTDSTAKKTPATTHSSELADDVRESAKAGQQEAGAALQKFQSTLTETVPELVEPLRNKIVDAAIELADQLVTTQYNFQRSLVRTADRALRGPANAK
jgi:hypothetical protein